MLSFFRRIINSKAGLLITFIVLGIIALAFAAGDVTGLRSTAMNGLGTGSVATVGGTKITPAEVIARSQAEVESVRQKDPTADMTKFLAAGALGQTLEQLISSTALNVFGAQQGMVVSRRAVDGQIASIPSLQGPTGKFDPILFRSILAQRKMTEAQVRSDLAIDTMGQQLTLPSIGAQQVSLQLALPYASLLLEKRAGLIGFIPSQAVPAGAAPTDAELQTFFGRNLARYTVPARRVIRYALVTPDQVKARTTPSDAEIAQAYQAGKAGFAPAEKRTIAQVVVADQAGADAIAARVKAGTTLAAAATAAGLEASTQTGVQKSAYALTTTPQIADTVFAAAKGAVIGPVRGPLGWTIARIESIEQVPGKSLDQARAEIAATLTRQKTAEALGAVHDSIDASLAKNATFDEVVSDQKLAAVTTPAMLANGTNPDDPASKPDPAIAPIVAAGFQAQEGDGPQMVQTGADGGFAVVAIGRIVPSAPRPLAQVRETVVRDFAADRMRLAARRIAGDVLAKVTKGTPLPQALAQTNLKLPGVQPLAASRAQLAANPRGAPAPLALMFSMKQGTAKLLEAPNGAGWFVIRLDRIDAGNATGNPGVIAAARGDMSRSVGREYVDQFLKAVRATVGVKTDAAALARVRAQLAGQGGSNN